MSTDISWHRRSYGFARRIGRAHIGPETPLIRALLSHLNWLPASAEVQRVGSVSRLPQVLVADLRTDHAGETGAVMIYRGILATTRDGAVRQFALAHLATETKHLAALDPLLPLRERSRLLPIWRIAGWLTGALPALVGPRAVFATIEAVETFVDHHYTEQIDSIDRLDPGQERPALQAVRDLLVSCRADEIEHRDEAATLFVQAGSAKSLALRAWTWAVGSGSRLAVGVCRRF